jgi:CDP-glycerol glycerophosphotransferase
VKVVTRGSGAYLRALARAAYWVDNQTFPRYVRKRPQQRYLQTWHGIPLKKMGYDEPGAPPPPQHPDRGVGAWDELVVPNRYFEETFVPAYRYSRGLVRYGTPRNDALVDGSLGREEARRQLDLPLDSRVVLYAPTFRQDNRAARVAVEIPFDVEELFRNLGDNTYLLLRPHYLNRIRVPVSSRHRTLDVSQVEDVNVLYHAADVLVTDYSSVMFDFAVLRKPIIFYTWDYAEYLATRGTYFDLVDVGPGPFVTSTEALASALVTAEADRVRFAAKYDAFLQRYCGEEDGKASARAVAALLGESEEVV